MDHVIRFTDPEHAVVVASGTASLEAIDAVATELLGDARYQPGTTLIFDRRRLELGVLAPADVDRRLRLSLEDSDLIGPRRVAVVVTESETVEASTGRQRDPAWRRFATLEEAHLWLSSAAPLP